MGAHHFNPNARGGPLVLRDQLNRPLAVGDEVLIPQLVTPRYRVTDLTPVLDPKAPDGLMRIIVTAQVVMYLQAREPAPQILRVRTAAEVAEPGAVPPAAGLPSDRAPEAPEAPASPTPEEPAGD